MQRLGSIALIVPGYDEAIAFFVNTLGFQLLEDIDQGRKRWVRVRPPSGGAALVLERAESPDQMDLIGRQFAGRVGLFLETDQFLRDYEAMRSAGITFEEEPRTEPYGRVAVWRDPWSNRWDLLEPTGSAASVREQIRHNGDD
ncbi:VOC family protein [Palleronia caenipelagi]|uniref:VOC family protein n=1 Tax=Palleronia caenipelagi TaxID=2489174 RepID=A0A547PXX7_9RHOB|nr:VOC family protein [Palleronia caenipelagi]TRD18898.1 VOC family protein [Palleronia caenipelagi]